MKYSDRPIDPQLIDLGKRDQDFLLYYGDKPLKTTGGHEYSHTSDRLLRMILLEALQNRSIQLEEISFALLFEFQKDYPVHGQDLILKHFEALLDADPFIAMKVSGKGIRHLFGAREGSTSVTVSDGSMISDFWSVSSLMGPLNDQISRMLGRFEVSDTGADPLYYLVKSAYAERNKAEKSVMQVLCFCHRAGITLPLLWVLGHINAAEYVSGLKALRNHELLTRMDKIAEASVLPFCRKRYGDTVQGEENYGTVGIDLSVARDYLSVLSSTSHGERDITSLIRAGESSTLEFKSTLRWDLKAGKTNPAIERASLKTISAFLNTDGGILLIGIRDDGSVEGIESDKLANEDKFLLHFWTLVRTCFGKEVSPYIRTDLQVADEKTICIVTCSRCDYPVFLHQPGFPEEFYIRTGPGSNALSVSEALRYIADRFPANG